MFSSSASTRAERSRPASTGTVASINSLRRAASACACIESFLADFFRLRCRGGEERFRFPLRAAEYFVAFAPGLGENFRAQSCRRI